MSIWFYVQATVLISVTLFIWGFIIVASFQDSN
jgi:hypothetical protein